MVGSGQVSVKTEQIMYFVYVLKSQTDNNHYYGFTTNLKKRLLEHNTGKVQSTKSRTPFELIYFEKVDTLLAARKREKYFKTGFGRKYIKNKTALSSIG